MQIHRLPTSSTNYIFLLYSLAAKAAVVVDPTEADPVLEILTKLDADLLAILNTHHHWDHVGGNQTLLQTYPQAEVYASVQDRGRIPGQTQFLQAGDRITVFDRGAEVFFIPGHTRGHIAYYFPPALGETWGELFCGDTIFSAGCGRLFEGTPAQMVQSLTQLKQLPDKTRIWCAHEYTLSNLKFALTVEPDNVDLYNRYQEVKALRDRHQPTIPTEMGLEKRTNPFLRWENPVIQQAMGQADPIATFAELRHRKDRF
ncbi:hydroxyacylglutathione hydrolase [Alkalinema pantanalense CENA528]|uniref:hydroxyacylglutathione hydrolase n=1 Tax=Alkalinema pantanalense TaxID=1620705 RepID=UPI003D6DACB9